MLIGTTKIYCPACETGLVVDIAARLVQCSRCHRLIHRPGEGGWKVLEHPAEAHGENVYMGRVAGY
jgi:ribosomal protein S27E